MLHEFIAANRGEIIARCREKVAARSDPLPTEAEINHGVPVFLDQLVDALRLGLSSNPEIGRSAILHGHDLLRQGFSVSQVVHDYGDVCQSITELAVEKGATFSSDDFRRLNRCLDDAIASAVTEYGREQKKAAIEGDSAAHELRELISTAMLAFEILKTGNVGIAGSTAAVLHRSLQAMSALVGRLLAEVPRVKH